MESPREKFERLLRALEDLIAQEASLIAAGDYAAVVELQQRMQPVIESLVLAAPDVATDVSRAKFRAMLETRQQSIAALNATLAATKEELNVLQQSTHRAAKIVPAYGRAAQPTRGSQLRTSG